MSQKDLEIPRPELWRPDETDIGFDVGIAAEDILVAAGIRVYCDEDPFRIDCMRAVMRRLQAMTGRKADAPSVQERRDAVDRLEDLVAELRTAIGNTRPIDYAKAYELEKAEVERMEENDDLSADDAQPVGAAGGRQFQREEESRVVAVAKFPHKIPPEVSALLRGAGFRYNRPLLQWEGEVVWGTAKPLVESKGGKITKAIERIK